MNGAGPNLKSIKLNRDDYAVYSLQTAWPASGRNRPLGRATNRMPNVQRLASSDRRMVPSRAWRHQGITGNQCAQLARGGEGV